MKQKISTAIRLSLLGLLTISLNACAEEKSGEAVTVYNHMGKGVTAEIENGPGGDAPPYDGGGAYMCCISIPAKWRPDLKVNVVWSIEGENALTDDNQWIPTHKAEVKIPEYKELGSMQIHVISEDEVKVFVSPYALNHPNHPLYELGLKTHQLYVEHDKIQTAKDEQELQEMREREASAISEEVR